MKKCIDSEQEKLKDRVSQMLTEDVKRKLKKSIVEKLEKTLKTLEETKIPKKWTKLLLKGGKNDD